MIQQDTLTRLANRIGRITLATMLAALFSTVIHAIRNPLEITGPLAFIDELVYLTFTTGIYAIFALVAVPLVTLALWGGERLTSRERAWQATVVLAGLSAVGFAYTDTANVTVLEVATSTLVAAAYAGAVVLSVAIVEWTCTDRSSPTTVPTFAAGIGGVLAVCLVVVLVVGAGATAVGAVMPADDPRDDDTNGEEGAKLVDETTIDGGDDETDDSESGLERLLDGRDVTDPETYDDGEYSPRIRNASVVGESDAVTVSGVDEADYPSGNDTPSYPVSAVYADGEGVTVSDIEFEIENETVVPKGHYHLEIDGVDTSTTRHLRMKSHWAYDSVGDARFGAFVATGWHIDLEGGYYVDMEDTTATSVYFDLVNDDGEVERHVVRLEREDV